MSGFVLSFCLPKWFTFLSSQLPTFLLFNLPPSQGFYSLFSHKTGHTGKLFNLILFFVLTFHDQNLLHLQVWFICCMATKACVECLTCASGGNINHHIEHKSIKFIKVVFPSMDIDLLRLMISLSLLLYHAIRENNIEDNSAMFLTACLGCQSVSKEVTIHWPPDCCYYNYSLH